MGWTPGWPLEACPGKDSAADLWQQLQRTAGLKPQPCGTPQDGSMLVDGSWLPFLELFLSLFFFLLSEGKPRNTKDTGHSWSSRFFGTHPLDKRQISWLSSLQGHGETPLAQSMGAFFFLGGGQGCLNAFQPQNGLNLPHCFVIFPFFSASLFILTKRGFQVGRAQLAQDHPQSFFSENSTPTLLSDLRSFPTADSSSAACRPRLAPRTAVVGPSSRWATTRTSWRCGSTCGSCRVAPHCCCTPTARRVFFLLGGVGGVGGRRISYRKGKLKGGSSRSRMFKHLWGAHFWLVFIGNQPALGVRGHCLGPKPVQAGLRISPMVEASLCGLMIREFPLGDVYVGNADAGASTLSIFPV